MQTGPGAQYPHKTAAPFAPPVPIHPAAALVPASPHPERQFCTWPGAHPNPGLNISFTTSRPSSLRLLTAHLPQDPESYIP